VATTAVGAQRAAAGALTRKGRAARPPRCPRRVRVWCLSHCW
jgi:hypothetical protein